MPETGIGQNRVSFYVEDVWDVENPAKPTVIVQPVNIYNRLGDTLTVDRSFQVPLERTTRQETVNGGTVTRQVWQATVRFVAPTLLANLIVINPDGLFRSYPILFDPTQGATLSDMFQKGRELMKAEATSGEIRRHVDQVLQEITDLKRGMEYLADTGIKDGAVTVPKLAAETKIYIETQVKNRVDQVVGTNVSGSLDTLKELAEAISGNQPVTTNLVTQIGDRYTKTESDSRFASASHTHSSSQITDATPNPVANTIAKRDGNKALGTSIVWMEAQPTKDDHATRKDYVDSLGPVAAKVNAATAAAEPNKLVLRNSEGNIHLGDETKQGETLLDLRSQKLAFRILANDTVGREDFGVWRLKDETTTKRSAGSILRYLNQTNEWNFQGTKIANIAEPTEDVDAVNWGKVKNAVKWTSEATVAATASTLIWRDSNGRAQVRDPKDNWDIVNKEYVQPTIDAVTAATAYNTPNTLVKRSETGFISAAMVSVTAEPTQGTHVASKQYVDDQISKLNVTKDNVTSATPNPVANTIVKRDANKNFSAGSVSLENQPTSAAHATRKDYVDNLVSPIATTVNGATALAQPNKLVLRNSEGNIHLGDETKQGETLLDLRSQKLAFRILANDTVGREDFGVWRLKDETTTKRSAGSILRYLNQTNEWNFQGTKIANIAEPTEDVDAVNWGKVKNAVKWTSEATTAATARTLVWRDANNAFGAGTIWLENQPTNASHATRKDYVDSLGPVATKVNSATDTIGSGHGNQLVKTTSKGHIEFLADVEAGTDNVNYRSWPNWALVPRAFVDKPLFEYNYNNGQFVFRRYAGGKIVVHCYKIKKGYWAPIKDWAVPRNPGGHIGGLLFPYAYPSKSYMKMRYNSQTKNLEVAGYYLEEAEDGIFGTYGMGFSGTLEWWTDSSLPLTLP